MAAAQVIDATTPKRGRKSILMTPDPYHTPGYGGFCPQFKYQIGQTFGKTTARLLTDKQVASSGQLVLGDILPLDKRTDPRVQVLQARKQSWGDQKLVTKMVPGYTGFIPKSQHFFGKRYAENCLSASSDFEVTQNKHLSSITKMAEAQKAANRLKPLPAIEGSMEPKPYISKDNKHHSMSPYYMNNHNADKRFMSGYTGFVPRARGKIGSGYPEITHVALNEFTDDAKHVKAMSAKPIDVGPKQIIKEPTKPIYPVETGLVPHYTGHIPGEKFRYGQTFGYSTANALKDKRPVNSLTK